VRNEFLYYSRNGFIEGIRERDWKLLVPIPEKSKGLAPAPPSGPMLFDLATDPGERNNLAAENPDLVERLIQLMRERDKVIATAERPVWRKAE
jgi:arylsulfatase A